MGDCVVSAWPTLWLTANMARLGTVSHAHGLVREELAAPVCHADETRHQSRKQTLYVGSGE